MAIGGGAGGGRAVERPVHQLCRGVESTARTASYLSNKMIGNRSWKFSPFFGGQPQEGGYGMCFARGFDLVLADRKLRCVRTVVFIPDFLSPLLFVPATGTLSSVVLLYLLNS